MHVLDAIIDFVGGRTGKEGIPVGREQGTNVLQRPYLELMRPSDHLQQQKCSSVWVQLSCPFELRRFWESFGSHALT